MGVPIHVISYNLLLNYTSAFSRMGSSEIGFLSAHNSRMQFQYGAEQEVLLPWYIWNKAVMFFWSQVLNLPLEKLFICDYCGPGFFIVTCCCPKKKVYGFKKMIQGESPCIIFDIIRTLGQGLFPNNNL